MMDELGGNNRACNGHHLAWIYCGLLTESLDASTWLRTVDELRRSGWRVTLIAAGKGGHQQIGGVDVLCFPRPEVYLLRQVAFHLRVLRWLIAEIRAVDVILFHEMSAPWMLMLRTVFRFMRGQHPLMVMDTRSLPMEDREQESRKERVRGAAFWIANRIGNVCADGRVAITGRMAQMLNIPEGILWGTWPSGVDIEPFASACLKRRWPVADDSVVLVYHGSQHRERNLLTLCRAVMVANAKGMSFVLSLVGGGNQHSELAAFAAEAEGAIRVLPSVPHGQIPDLLGEAHVGVVPFPDENKFRVSSPIKLFEYMAAGLPILATRVVCHTDVVGEGDYVFWAEDAGEEGLLAGLTQVWESRRSLPVMGRHATLASKAWTWAESAKKLGLALEKGMKKTRRGATRFVGRDAGSAIGRTI